MKYNLADKTTRPDFDYILLSGSYWTKYYLYRADEFEEAYNQLKSEFAKGFHLAVLCEPNFNTNSREWRAQPLFRSTHKKKTEVFLCKNLDRTGLGKVWTSQIETVRIDSRNDYMIPF